MKKEIAEKWVADLRTNPPQCIGKLYDGKGHCCLGRLCLVLGAEFKETDGVWRPKFPEAEVLEDSAGYLTEKARVLSGMQSTVGAIPRDANTELAGSYLTTMNDRGKTFAEIADVIEQNWEGL